MPSENRTATQITMQWDEIGRTLSRDFHLNMARAMEEMLRDMGIPTFMHGIEEHKKKKLPNIEEDYAL